jgi:superfamily II DNA or RNA helicase
MFCHIAERAAKRGKRIMILVHRKELLRQCSEELEDMDVSHGLIAPGHTMNGDYVQVASKDTLIRRLNKVIPPDLIIVDEGHHAVAKSWERIIRHYGTAHVLGITATPLRLDGKGLGVEAGGIYDSMVCGPNTKRLIELGWLSKPIVFAPPVGFEVKGIKRKMGDYDRNQLEELLDKPKIVGNCVEHYKKICPGKPFMAFGVSIKHAEAIATAFNDSGIPTMSIDGTMSDRERKMRLTSLGNGRLKGITSCDLISEGVNVPIVSAAILLRPTQSTAIFMQQCGRALRPHPDKDCTYILDHVGNCWRHGMPDDEREWTLGSKEFNTGMQVADETPVLKNRSCEYCYAMFPAKFDFCPQCGKEYTGSPREIKEVEGKLQKVDKEAMRIEKRGKRREQGRSDSLEALEALGKSRVYKYYRQWARHVWNARQRKLNA